MKKRFSTLFIVRAGVISALYIVLSLTVFPLASGPIQIRLGEALTFLPLIMPESIPALFIGCFVSNLITGCNILDVVFGSFVTFLSSTFTFFAGRIIKGRILRFFIGGIFPVILNAFLLPVIWYFCYGKSETLYIMEVLYLLLSQALSVYLLGGGIYFSCGKLLEEKLK